MSYYPLSALINGITLTILGFLVFLKNKKNIVNQTYVIYCVFIAAWSYSYFVWQISDSFAGALLWCRILMAWAILIPVAYLHFVLHLIGRAGERKKTIFFGYVLSMVFIIADVTPRIVKTVEPKMCFRFWPTAGTFYTLFLVYFASYAFYAIALIFIEYFRSANIKRNQYKYVLIGTILGYIGGATNYPLWYDVNIPPYGNILISVYVALVGYAIVRYRLMDIRVFLTRVGIFVLLYAVLLGFPFWFGLKTGLWIWATAIMGILASVGPYVFHLLKNKAEAMLLAQQRRYQQVLLEGSKGILRKHDLNDVLRFVAEIVRRSIALDYSAIYLENAEGKRFELVAGDSGPRESYLCNDQFTQFITHQTAPITFEELPDEVQKAVADQEIHVIVPFISQDRFMGFMLLGKKMDKTFFTKEDIEVLQTMTNQVAVAIENCLYVEEFKKSQERVFAAEKLASIGGMAEGIAHQLINRLNQFAVNSELIELKVGKYKAEVEDLPAIKKVFDDLNKVANSQGESVKRTYDMLRGILNYSTIEVKEQDFSHFKLEEIVNPALELLKVKHTLSEFPLKTVVTDGNDKLYGVKAQLMEALYNILDNAYEALKEREEQAKAKGESYKPEIVLKMSGGTLEIQDNGIGIKEENKAKIFAPFYSTKSTNKSGSGIGMYIVKRMVEEIHKGKISLRSEYGKGTTVRLEIPLRNR